MSLPTSGLERAIEPPPEQPAHGPLLTLSEAAETASVSRSTVRRRLAEGAFRGAHRDATGQWLVPVADLIQAGLTPAVSPALDMSTTPVSGAVDGVVSLPDLPARVRQLEQELAAERLRRELAERLATERLDRVEDMRLALRAIGPAPTEQTSPVKQRRWWRRRAG